MKNDLHGNGSRCCAENGQIGIGPCNSDMETL